MGHLAECSYLIIRAKAVFSCLKGKVPVEKVGWMQAGISFVTDL